MILSAIWNEISTSKIFQRRPKLHKPVGRVQFVVFEKIYKCLFIPNCTRKIMWLLINNIHEKIRDGWAEETYAYHAIGKKLRHPGRVLDLKTKDLIGYLWTSLFINQSECLLYYLVLHSTTSFLHCIKENLHCSQPIRIE